LSTFCFFFSQAEDGIRDRNVTGVQTCALPISHTGKWSAESVRGRKAECAVQRSILSKRGIPGGRISDLRSRQKWVPPGAWRFCEIGRASCRERGEVCGESGRGRIDDDDGWVRR